MLELLKLKYRIELENSGKTAHAVKQDFHAKVFVKNVWHMRTPLNIKGLKNVVRMKTENLIKNKSHQCTVSGSENSDGRNVTSRFDKTLEPFDQIVQTTRVII